MLPAADALSGERNAPCVLVSAPRRNELVLGGRGDEIVDLAKVKLFSVGEKGYQLPRFGYCLKLTEAANACLAHWQNFSVAGLSFPLRVAMPKESGFGSGVSRTSFTRLAKL